MKKNSFCALLILIGALQQCAADGLNQWTPNTWSVSSVNSLGDVWGVAYGDGIYLEAGDRNVATSTTGTQWTASTNIITANNAAVVFKSVAVSSSGVFVLVGTYGTIFSSADGLAWTPQTSPNDNHIYGVTWGNGSFVAVGQNASIITSTDGVTWNSISTPRGGDLLCVTYANGLFVAGATNGLLYTSPNGSTWTQSGSSSDAIYGLAYGGGTFVGVGSSGSVVTSGNNGVSWTQNKVAGVDSLNGVTFADGVFVADGDEGLVATSPDGVNWSTDFNNFGIQDEVYESASFANGKVFLAGDLGTNVVLDWPNDLNGVTSGKGMQVAVGGQGLIVSSTGGSAWARQVSGTANTLHAVAAGLASGGFTFLAVGDAGTVTTSANGTAWTAGSTGTANDLYAVAYTVNNTFVAVGAAGSIYTSSDGSTWTAQTSGTTATLRGIGYDSTYGTPGELVAVGDNGTILTSSDDGVTWVAQKSEDTATLYAALYAASQGLFVSVGDSSGDDLMVQTSQDATNWATQGTGPYPIHAVTFGDQIFVTVGEQGTIQASPDGTNWTGRASPTTSGLYGVTLANNSFLAVGQLGTIINSGPVLPFASLTSGTSSTLTGFAMGNGATSSNLVAVGAGGTIVTSDDGTTFAPVASSTTSGLSAVIFAGGQYVAVGASGAIITSSDGNAWAAAASGVTAGLTGVAYGDGNYVAVGGNSTVLTSSDGVTWTPAVVSQTENIVGVSFGNGVFVALDSDGTILTSPNGTTWTLNSPGLLTPLVSITFANGTFLGTDTYGGIYSSVDGVNWSDDFSLPPGSYSSVTYFNGELAAVGAGGSIISTPLQLGTPPSSTDLYAVTYGNGLYVAVGDSGTVLTSEDGNNWIAPSAYAGTANYLDGITYGNGTYIGVGNNGWTVTSPDGVNWTSINSGATANVLTGITFGDGQFVAVGIAGTIIDFSNSSGWTVSSYAASATDTNDSFDGVAYGNGQFVAVGNDSTTTFSSPTGATWTQGGGGYYADYSDGIAYGNGIFVGVASDGEIYTSTDGANWTQRAATEQTLNGVSFGGGLFVAVGTSGSIFSSQDGLTWVAVPSIVRREIYAVTYDGHAFVMVGANGIILSSVPKALTVPVPILLSETSYNTSVSDTNDDLTAITYGAGQFVVVGNDYNTSFSSATAQLWTQGGSGLGDDYYTGTAFGDGLYVAIDSNGGVYTSTDGSTWTHETGTQTTLNGLTFGNGIFVAVGNSGAVFTSSNAKQWAAQKTVGTHDLEAVIYDGANFVAVDDGGFIWTSANGITWASGGTEANGINQALYAITYNGSLYVAVGDGGQIVTSKTAKPSSIWTQPTNYVITDHFLDGIAWGAGQFVAVGQEGWIVTSPDGINWTANGSSTVQDLYAIQFAASQFVVVGHAGAILTVGEIPVITSQPQPATQFVPVGASVTLQVGISGSQSPNYQWQFDSGALQNSSTVSGANTATLTLSDLALTESGSYSVIVSDSLGSVTSMVAVVTVGTPPEITVQPIGFEGKRAKVPGQDASFTITATGTPPLSYTWQLNSETFVNGGGVSGATTSTLELNPVNDLDGGTYTVIVSSPYGQKASTGAILQLVNETTRPSVTITLPASNARTNKPAFKGTAGDAVRVEQVNYWITNINNGLTNVMSGKAALSAGTSVSNWVINATPLAGSNVLAVQSKNYSGDTSPMATRSFFYRVLSPLVLDIDPSGSGAIAGFSSIPGDPGPVAGNTELYIGEGYRVATKALTSWLFDFWTTPGAVVVSRIPEYSFIMEPDLNIEANFSANIFPKMAGRYDGLFYNTSNESFFSSGMIIDLAIKTDGVYSGGLNVGGTHYVMSGGFDYSGQSDSPRIQTAKASAPTVTASLNWSLSNSIPIITGSVTVGGYFPSPLYLVEAAQSEIIKDSVNYTMLIPPGGGNAAYGYGYATIANSLDMLTITGVLADGHKFTQSVPVGQDNEFPLYSDIIATASDSGLFSSGGTVDWVMGRLSLSTADTNNVPNGNLFWFRTTEENSRIFEGEISTNAVLGSPWTNSAIDLTNLVPPNSVATIISNNGAVYYQTTLKLGKAGALEAGAGSTSISDVTGSINAKNGLISAKVDDTNTGQFLQCTGVLLANTNFGGGFFINTSISALLQSRYSGPFTLEPPAQ